MALFDDLLTAEPESMIRQNLAWRRDALDNPDDFPVDEYTRRAWRTQVQAMERELARRGRTAA